MVIGTTLLAAGGMTGISSHLGVYICISLEIVDNIIRLFIPQSFHGHNHRHGCGFVFHRTCCRSWGGGRFGMRVLEFRQMEGLDDVVCGREESACSSILWGGRFLMKRF